MEDKRRFRRYPRNLKAKVRHKDGIIRAILVDYSLDGFGLIIHGRSPISKGETVDVEIDELSIKSPAIVRWTRQLDVLRRLGLEKKGGFEGRVIDYQLSDTFVGLQLTQKTGILNVRLNDIEKRVYVDKGNMIFSASNQPSDSLGAFLLRKGIITKEQFIEATKEMKRIGKRFGHALVNLGYLTPHQLFDSVRGHVEDIILSLFDLEDGRFFFEEGGIPTEETIRLSISPGNLIYYGVKRIRDVDRLKAILPMDGIVYFSSNPIRLFQDIRIDEPGKRVLSCIDNKSTIEDVIKRSGLEPSEAIKSIYGFMSIRLLLTTPNSTISVEEIMDALRDESEEVLKRQIDEMYEMYEKLGYYGVLGIGHDASQDEIKRAFYRTAKRFHPDRHFQLGDESIRNKLNTIFSYINEAYNVLSNPESRSEYDKKVFIKSHRIRTDEGSASGAYKKAVGHFNNHDYEMAEYYIKQAIYYDKTIASYHFLHGLTLMRLNRPEEAREPLQRATELEPFNPDYMAELGWLYLNEGLKLTARGFFEKALKIDPQHERTLRGLAALSKMG
ncbi:MAG: hypothetical protein Fur0020_08050 [Thermodesulfovibrionia bacterium]